MEANSWLSERGSAWQGEMHPLVLGGSTYQRNPYNPKTNTNGVINFGTAENSLIFNDLILPKLNRNIPIRLSRYNDSSGIPEFRKALARYLERYLEIPEIDPEHVGIATGASAVMDAFCWSVLNDGDMVMIPQPYYDCVKRAKCQVQGVWSSSSDHFKLHYDELERAFETAPVDNKPKVLVLTNPQNPSGRIYTYDELAAAIKFCQLHHMHLVSDEIYANSVHTGRFLSLFHPCFDAIMDPEFKKTRLHLIYGFAKDFGLSGYKVGVFYSPNSTISGVCHDDGDDHDTQQALLGLLDDVEYLDKMFVEYKSRLRERYEQACSLLDKYKLDYMTAHGAFFIMVDLRKYEMDDIVLFKAFLKNKIYLAAAEFFKCPEPGWFRLVYTGADDVDELELGIKRVADTLSEIIKSKM